MVICRAVLYKGSRVPNHLQTCHKVLGENFPTSCGYIERKDQGHTARLNYLFSGPLCIANEPIPYEDSNCICLSVYLKKLLFLKQSNKNFL